MGAGAAVGVGAGAAVGVGDGLSVAVGVLSGSSDDAAGAAVGVDLVCSGRELSGGIVPAGVSTVVPQAVRLSVNIISAIISAAILFTVLMFIVRCFP